MIKAICSLGSSGFSRHIQIDGLAVFSSDYRLYGTSWGVNGKPVAPFLYTGKPKDAVTGLYYYGARFYDPSVGRFKSEDTSLGSQQDPLSQNRYIYAEDNPMSFTDPTGHRPIGLDAQTEIEAKPVASTSTTTAGSTTTVTDVKVHPSGLTVTYATTPTTPTSVGSAPTTTASTTGGPPSQTCGRSRWESTCPDALTSGQVGMEEVIAIATAALIADVLLLDVPAASWYAANVGGALVYAYAKLIDYVDSS